MNNQQNARRGSSRGRPQEPAGQRGRSQSQPRQGGRSQSQASRGGRSQSQAGRAAQGMVNQMYGQQMYGQQMYGQQMYGQQQPGGNKQGRRRPPPRRIDDSSEPLLRLVRANKAILEGLAAKERVVLPATAGEFLRVLNFPGLTKAMGAVASDYVSSTGMFKNIVRKGERPPNAFLFFDQADFVNYPGNTDSQELKDSLSVVGAVANRGEYLKTKKTPENSLTVKDIVSAFAFFFAELERQLVKYMQRHLASKRRWATYVTKVQGVAKVSSMEMPVGTGNIEHDKKVYSDFLNRVAEEALAGKEGPLDTQNAQTLLMPRILSILDPKGENPLDLAENIKERVNKKYWHLFLEATPALKANARKARNYQKRQARSEAGGDDSGDDPMVLVHPGQPRQELYDEEGHFYAASRADSGIVPFSRLQSSAAAPVPTAEPPLASMPRFVSMRYD